MRRISCLGHPLIQVHAAILALALTPVATVLAGTQGAGTMRRVNPVPRRTVSGIVILSTFRTAGIAEGVFQPEPGHRPQNPFFGAIRPAARDVLADFLHLLLRLRLVQPSPVRGRLRNRPGALDHGQSSAFFTRPAPCQSFSSRGRGGIGQRRQLPESVIPPKGTGFPPARK
jgi:hypothetical protein